MKRRAEVQFDEAGPMSSFFRAYSSRIAQSRFDRNAGSGLSAHMRASRNRNHSLPRWLMITVAAGAVVALAFVNFLAR
jgi:hypothetical protein